MKRDATPIFALYEMVEQLAAKVIAEERQHL